MAVPKILGIETEFGILHRGVPEPNPVTASSLLINAYLSRCSAPGDGPGAPRVGWDFVDESPSLDLRGFSAFDAIAPEIETHLVNAVLTNGARYYVDHAHPELSTPECLDARDLVRFDRAAEQILIESMAAANEVLPEGQEIVVYKNNSDGKGNSYGCHENYLIDRATPFGRVAVHATTHFVTRQVFTGAGKVGCELPGCSRSDIDFQLTQRADFFEEEVGLETTLKRPIINTRDEPHADPLRYRRLHVIVGDANLCEVATFLKVGTTAIVLAMVDDDFLHREVRFADPVRALQEVSLDQSLGRALELADGTTATAIELQWDLLEQGRKYVEERGDEGVGGPVAHEVLDRWGEVLATLEEDPEPLVGVVDWVTKRHIINGYRDRHGLQPDDLRLMALDLQYHDLRPERSLFARMGAETLVDPADVERGMTTPPDGTRAYFRGRCLDRWSDSVVAANWDSMVFDAGEESLRRVPMMEPTRGSRAHVATLIDDCDDITELLDRLSGRAG
ncbi:MAG: depupylase/deamidase Dop [Acidimicrobiales bacterium]|jgi:proteasome accessory factor A|nr:depupylase/deamidase Dop [Acidimicrobiales bacterium]